MPFEYLRFANKNGPDRGEVRKSVFGLPRLRDRDLVVIGVSHVFPVLRLGHFLIKLSIPLSRRREIPHMGLFIGESRGGALVIENKEVYYQTRMTDTYSGIDPKLLHIMDTKTRTPISPDKTYEAIERVCYGGGGRLHSCDQRSANNRNHWFMQSQHILYKKGQNDYDWMAYSVQIGLSGARKYIDRRNRILNEMIGSRVKITDKSVFSDLRFKNKTGRIMCTIPDISTIVSSKKLLRALVVDFGEDVGGHSMDGRCKKGSCLVVPPEKVRVEGG